MILLGGLGPPGPTWGFLGLPGTLLGSFGASWGHLGLPGSFEAFWRFLGPPGASWGFLEHFLGPLELLGGSKLHSRCGSVVNSAFLHSKLAFSLRMHSKFCLLQQTTLGVGGRVAVENLGPLFCVRFWSSSRTRVPGPRGGELSCFVPTRFCCGPNAK